MKDPFFPFGVKRPPIDGQLYNQIDGFGIPPTPPGGDALLQESGDFLLQEDDGKILL